MHYFIDGYNLVFRISAGDDNLQKMRKEVIQDLAVKINLIKLDATLVFDAQYQHNESSRSHVNHLGIVFTAIGETADEFIIAALKEERYPAEHTVITSDKQLAWLAKRCQANVKSVEEFNAWLDRRYKNKLRILKKITAVNKQIPQFATGEAPMPRAPVKFVPTLSSSAVECFEFYLERFEKDYLSLRQDKPTKDTILRANGKKKSRKPKPAQEEEEGQSDMVRWLKAFHRSVDGDDSQLI